tara:strand:- start:1645 stop:1827 length:183 start_codon:yes stop_codon:yes gene_type:complete
MKIDEKKADLNKDGKLSGYERKRGEAVARNLNKGGYVEVQGRGCGAMIEGKRKKTRIPQS